MNVPKEEILEFYFLSPSKTPKWIQGMKDIEGVTCQLMAQVKI